MRSLYRLIIKTNMPNKKQKGQGIIWVILIIVIIALIALWISKNPSSSTTTIAPETTESNNVDTVTPSIKETMTDKEIELELKELNDSAGNIDNGINDSQLDINAK